MPRDIEPGFDIDEEMESVSSALKPWVKAMRSWARQGQRNG